MNQQCKVCGEPAAGFHFGAFTCEGCKSFFGRTYNNLGSISECKNNGECVINKKNRTTCKACRLRKCLLVGMSKSGSRYGRRSNWFKIHCLLQEQQQQAANQAAHVQHMGMQHNPALLAPGLLRPHPYFPFLRVPPHTQTNMDGKSSESEDSGASSADPDDDLRSASALACTRPIASPCSSDRGDYFTQTNTNTSSTKKLLSPASDSECFARRKYAASITLALPASPASLPSVSPGGGGGGGLGLTSPWLPPPLNVHADPTSWRELWLRGPRVADPEPTSQEQPIDLSLRANPANTTPSPSVAPSEASDQELNIDVGVEDGLKPVPLDLVVKRKSLTS